MGYRWKMSQNTIERNHIFSSLSSPKNGSDEKISIWPRSGTADLYPGDIDSKSVSEHSERQA
jgi:hypothetical protein